MKKNYKKQLTKEHYKLGNGRHPYPVTPISVFCKIMGNHIHGSRDIKNLKTFKRESLYRDVLQNGVNRPI